MSLQEQINTLKKQIENSLETLNSLSDELKNSESPTSSSQLPKDENNTNIKALLAVGEIY